MSQFPYESLSREKQRNAEAFANWVGGAAAAITTTFWNIITIHACATRPAQFEKQNESDRIENAFYILSCVNQYEDPRRPDKTAQDQRRDTALLRGVLWPYVKTDDPRLKLDRRRWVTTRRRTSSRWGCCSHRSTSSCSSPWWTGTRPRRSGTAT